MKKSILNAKRVLMTLVAVLTIGASQLWATDCTLKVWNKATNSYVTWRTISDGYEFGSAEYPYYDGPSGFYSVTAWGTNDDYYDSYPSGKYYYYNEQIYGKLVDGVAYKPTTLYAIYSVEDFGGIYTSKPDYQLYIPTIMITYKLTGLTLTSGPHGFNNTTTTYFSANFSYDSGYGGTVTGKVWIGNWSYDVTYDQYDGVSFGDADFTLGTLRFGGGAMDEDVLVELEATASSCEDLADASSLAVNTSYVSGGNTYVRFTWTLGTGTSTNATNQKICYGLDGSAGSCNASVSKTQTAATGLQSGFSNGKYWWSIQALGDGTSYCDGDVVNGPAFCIDEIASATPSGISATPTSTTAATITWDAVSDAAYYDIEVKNNSTNAVVCSDEVEGTSFNATSLTTNTEYRVELQAFNACDEASVKSTSFTFTIVQYTVHWYVNGALWEGAEHGSPATTVLSGARPSPLPTAPDAGDYCGSAFMGWTDHEITGSSGKPDPLFKQTAPVATGNKTFYAVFADEQP